MAFESAKEDIEIRIKLPTCAGCKSSKITPVVQSYNLEEREVHVIVHKDFIKAFTAQIK